MSFQTYKNEVYLFRKQFDEQVATCTFFIRIRVMVFVQEEQDDIFGKLENLFRLTRTKFTSCKNSSVSK